MDFTRWQTIKMLQNPSKRLGTPEAATPATDRWAQGAERHHQAGSRPRPALTQRLGAHTRAARTRSGAGRRRRGGARPERARGGVHGDKEEAASLTGGGAGEERRRMGGAAALGGGGPRRAAADLHGEAQGRVSAGIGGGGGEGAPRARN